MYSNDLYDAVPYEQKLYMQINEWFWSLLYRNLNEYMERETIDRIQDNINKLKETKFEKSLISDVEEKLEAFKNGNKDRVME